jgi:hypothetical protein
MRGSECEPGSSRAGGLLPAGARRTLPRFLGAPFSLLSQLRSPAVPQYGLRYACAVVRRLLVESPTIRWWYPHLSAVIS